VSNRELLVRVYERLGKLDAKFDTFREELVDLRQRVGLLEKGWAKLTGTIAAVAVPVTAAFNYLRHKLLPAR
jgi:hypothetical protein